MYCIGTIKQLKYGYFGIPGLGAMETAYIPHNHTLTVYCNAYRIDRTR